MEASSQALLILGVEGLDQADKGRANAKPSRRVEAIARHHNKMYERPESSTAISETVYNMSGFHGDEIYIVHRIECGRTSYGQHENLTCGVYVQPNCEQEIFVAVEFAISV